MPALVLKRSSLVMPGFLGTPAGMTTTSAPDSASSNPAFPLMGKDTGLGNLPMTDERVGMWERSAATPGVPTMS
jgi:hypothetical protein